MNEPNTLQNSMQFYDEDHLFFSTETTNAERTENELEFIWQALELKQGEAVLDLGVMNALPMVWPSVARR